MTTVKCRQHKCVRNKKGRCQCETITLQDNGVIVKNLICVEAQEKQMSKRLK